MKSQTAVSCLFVASFLYGVVGLRAEAEETASAPTRMERTLLTWMDPQAHVTGSVGESSGDPETLATGHHDPTREDGTVQGIELGSSLVVNEYIQGFASYNLHYGADEEWEGEWEEGYLKLTLPEVGEIRGGRFLARFGELNAQHLHSWNWVDVPLVYGRYLGDDGLILDGSDATVFIHPSEIVQGAVIFAYGQRPSQDHDHADAHEPDHTAGGEDDEPDLEGVAEDHMFSARALIRFSPDDFWSWSAGASAALGKTPAGSDVDVYGLDLSLTWRENGYEAGGQALRWTTELLCRDAEGYGAAAPDDDPGHDHDPYRSDDSSWGLYTSLMYTVCNAVDTGLRLGWVDASDSGEEVERLRVSPVLTYWLDSTRRTHLRAQYNYDDVDESEEHTVWLQVGASFGGSEVR